MERSHKKKNHQISDLKNSRDLNEREDFTNHVDFEDIDVPQIHEPLPACTICNEPIEQIAEAISESNGGYSHFDCVLKRLVQEYDVNEPDKVSYIGQGNFAVVHPDENGSYIIVKKIQYESQELYGKMKKFVEENKS